MQAASAANLMLQPWTMGMDVGALVVLAMARAPLPPRFRSPRVSGNLAI